MLGLLVKKQLTEVFRGYFINSKTNTKRSVVTVVSMFALYGVLMVGFIGGLNAFLANVLCKAFCSIGLSWMYFALFALLSILLGVFGSVFSTYSSLYLAKDNDLLLSMPIPVNKIVISRILNVYIMGVMYSIFVFIPCIVVYFIEIGFDLSVLIGSLEMLLLVTVIVLVLSCLLGWVVAKCSLKLKNKSYMRVGISLVFIGLYYFFYFKAQDVIRDVIANAALYGKILKEKAGIIYFFGRCAEGDVLSEEVSLALLIILPLLTVLVLSKTFIKIATATGNEKKAVYVEKSKKQSSVGFALFKKELARFTSSSSYMLNCGLGVLFLPAAGVVILLKGERIFKALLLMLPKTAGLMPVFVVSVVCLLASMNDMAAPSVSLEGKNIWLTQSLPVSMWYVLRAKVLVQVVFTVPVMLFCGICAVLTFKLSLLENVFVVAMSVAFTVLNALFGMFLGIKMPNLTWTSEIKPIKQSACVVIALFGAFIYSAAIGIIYFFFGKALGSELYLGCVLAVTLILSLVLYRYLKTKGARIFATL